MVTLGVLINKFVRCEVRKPHGMRCARQLTVVSWRTWTKQGKFKRAALAMDSDQTGTFCGTLSGEGSRSDGDPGHR